MKRARAELPPQPRRVISHRPRILHREKSPPEPPEDREIASHKVVDPDPHPADPQVADCGAVDYGTANREEAHPSMTHRVANHGAPHYGKPNRNARSGEETMDQAPETP